MPRVDAVETPVTANARTGSRLPFSSRPPRSVNANARAARAVRSETSTSPDSAATCSRAATLTTSPVTIASPGAASSAASTEPVLTPMRIGEADAVRARQPGVDLVEAAQHGECGPDRALGVVLVHDRHAEHRHHRVADELLDPAALGLGLGAHGVEVAAQHLGRTLRVQPLRHPGRAREVGEQDGDDLALGARWAD